MISFNIKTSRISISIIHIEQPILKQTIYETLVVMVSILQLLGDWLLITLFIYFQKIRRSVKDPVQAVKHVEGHNLGKGHSHQVLHIMIKSMCEPPMNCLIGTYQVLGLFNPQLVFCVLPRQMLQLQNLNVRNWSFYNMRSIFRSRKKILQNRKRKHRKSN